MRKNRRRLKWEILDNTLLASVEENKARESMVIAVAQEEDDDAETHVDLVIRSGSLDQPIAFPSSQFVDTPTAGPLHCWKGDLSRRNTPGILLEE